MKGEGAGGGAEMQQQGKKGRVSESTGALQCEDIMHKTAGAVDAKS
jgi:hypothetical protein